MTQDRGRDPVPVTDIILCDDRHIHETRQDDPLSELAIISASRAQGHDRPGDLRVDSLTLTEAARHGLDALTIPRALGGNGASLAQTVSVARLLGAGDPAATLILATT